MSRANGVLDYIVHKEEDMEIFIYPEKWCPRMKVGGKLITADQTAGKIAPSNCIWVDTKEENGSIIADLIQQGFLERGHRGVNGKLHAYAMTMKLSNLSKK
jgi:hypothetical protein